MRYLVTADYHLCHDNIRFFEKGRQRFKSVLEMNDYIVRQHNEQVKEEDIVYHIGDFLLKNSSLKDKDNITLNYKHFLKQLNGRLILIEGNHDKNAKTKCECDSLIKRFMDYKINFVHRPCDMRSDVDFNIVGHSHSSYKYISYDNKKGINVGLDQWDLKLVPLNFIVELYRKIDWEKIETYVTK